jgi:glutathione S-transferase
VGERRILYQFPQSHFAEKGRWLLDAKGLSYEARNLYPVLNRLFLWPRTGVMTIPALNDNGRWTGDSTRIALYLDSTYPELPALLSDDPEMRSWQLQINSLAERIGVLIRQQAMIYLINTPIPPTLYYQDAPLSGPLKSLATWVFRTAVTKMYRASPEHIPAVTAALSALLDQAEMHVLARRSRFLIGEQLSLADISLCSMLAPALAPPESPWASITSVQVDSALVMTRMKLAQRPLGQFVYEMYADHRNSKNNWRGHW